MRAVFDANVFVSALLSATGTPATLMKRWLAGEFELIVSAALLTEIQRVCKYPKLQERITTSDVTDLIDMLETNAKYVKDPLPTEKTNLSRDLNDNYLIALAYTQTAYLVSGDGDLLVLAPHIPVISPREFLATLP